MKKTPILLIITLVLILGNTGLLTATPSTNKTICNCITARTNTYSTGLLPGGPPLPKSISFTGATPPSWDWRSATYNSITGDWTTPIKDQGHCGSCYAFGSLAALESVMNIKNDNPDLDRDLSEQFMVSCGQEWMSGFFGCDGAYLTPTYNFLKDHGTIPESCFSYVSGNSGYVPPCSEKCDNWEDLIREVKDWHPVSSDSESIKNALLQYGPLSTTMVVYDDFKWYTGGVYEHPGSEPDPTNHLVTIVGYNDDQSYWICKNSWGTDWGENGWFRIAYGDCKIEKETVYLDYEPQSDIAVTVTIHRIQMLDEIEGILQGEADLAYRISVYNGEEWSEAYNLDYSEDEDDHT
jgi:C1A family cysteine protease